MSKTTDFIIKELNKKIMQKIQKDCINECPNCGSENIDYKESYPEGVNEIFPFVCLDCHTYAEEVFALIYQHTEYDHEGKIPKDYVDINPMSRKEEEDELE